MTVADLTDDAADASNAAQAPHGPGALPDVPLEIVAALAHSAKPSLVQRLAAEPGEPWVAYANPAFLRVSGYPLAEVLGAPSFRCWGTELDHAAFERAVAAVNREETVDLPAAFRHRDGTRHRGVWRLTPVPGSAAGHPGHFVSAFHDGSPLQRRTLALAQQTAAGDALFANHLDAVFELDVSGRIMRANAAMTHILGYGEAELVGRSVLSLIAPDDPAAGGRHLREALDGRACVIEARLVTKDGRRIHVRSTKTPVVVEGLVVGVYGMFADVSEAVANEESLRESEARYRVLVEHSPEGVCIVQDDRFTYVNPASARICTGHPDPTRVIGHAWTEYTHPEDRATVRAVIDDVLGQPDGVTRPYENRVLWPDGQVRVYEATAAHVRYAGRDAVQCAGRDVTEPRHADAERRRTQRMEALGRLAAGVAHDVNNLLAVMLGAVELAADAVAPDDVSLRADLEAAADAAPRGRALTRQLLTFARRQESQPQRVDVNALVEGMGELLRRIAGPRVRLELALAPDAGAVVADPAQAEQVLLNLVTNARDALPDGGEVRVETAHENGDLRLTVRDTGPGIPPEVRPHLFEPFFSTKAEGHGLGLATVYGVVTGAGGRVDVESEPGHGAAFHLRLPRAA